AEAGQAFLHGAAAVAGWAGPADEEGGLGGAGGGGRGDGVGDGRPLRGGVGTFVKEHAAKHAWVGEDEPAIVLHEHEVVAFAGCVVGGDDGELAGHAEVDAEPESCAVASGGAEEHLFGGGRGGVEARAGEAGGEGGGVGFFEDAGLRMKEDVGNGLTQAGVPAAAVVFDFGEFGHGVQKNLKFQRAKSQRWCLFWRLEFWLLGFAPVTGFPSRSGSRRGGGVWRR